MRKLILTLALAAAGLTGARAEVVNAVKVTLNNGDTEVFVLADKPKITFDGDDLVVTSPVLTKSYLRSSVKNVTFCIKDLSVSDIAAGETSYTYIDNVFSCPGADITVYNLSGVAVANGHETVSLAGQADGFYIIKTNFQTLKVVKR